MYQISQDELMFFGQQPGVIPVYEAFAGKLLAAYPDTKIKVSKSQMASVDFRWLQCTVELGRYGQVRLNLFPLR